MANMRILAIDPGPRQSAWLTLWAPDRTVLEMGIWDNDRLAPALEARDSRLQADLLLVEMVEHYGRGMPAGKDVFRTCVWIGWFEALCGMEFAEVARREVKLALCGDSRAKDSNIRQALIDRYPPTGGGKVPQIGTKAKPGPLYGIKRDLWAALGVAVVWCERSLEAGET